MRYELIEILDFFNMTFRLGNFFIGKFQKFEYIIVKVWSSFKCPGPKGVSDNVFYLRLRVSKMIECARDRLINYFEISSTGKLFPFYYGKIRLYSGCIAIHEKSYGTGW